MSRASTFAPRMLAIAVLLVSGWAGTTALRADIYVSTLNGDSVQRHSEINGTLLQTITSPLLDGVTGVTEGPNGNLYISSSNNQDILKYDGNAVTPFISLPVAAFPAHLRFGADGNLYVANNQGQAIEKYNGTTGALMGTVGSVFAAGGFTFAANGDMYLGDFGSGAVYRIQQPTSAAPVQTLFIAAGSGPSLMDPLSGPSGILTGVGIDNDVLVSDLFRNRILRFDANGTYEGVFATIPQVIPAGEQFQSNAPTKLIFDREGDSILVAVNGYTQAEAKGQVLRYDLNGTLLQTLADGIPSATDVALSVAVPEPSTCLLALIGLAGMITVLRRKLQVKQA